MCSLSSLVHCWEIKKKTYDFSSRILRFIFSFLLPDASPRSFIYISEKKNERQVNKTDKKKRMNYDEVLMMIEETNSKILLAQLTCIYRIV